MLSKGLGAPRTLGILAFCGRDQIGLEDGLLPLATLFLSFGEVGNRGLRGLIPPLPVGVVLGEDGPYRLFAQGEVGGDVEERGSRAWHVLA